jgi:arsenite-transporting ATPase
MMLSAMTLASAIDSLGSRRLLLFGGKGGVGKTTVSAAAALQLARTRPVILFTTDPASNLGDLFGNEAPPPNLRVESLDAGALYKRFLETNLDAFLELGDRGTYLDRDELRRFFELSLPGVDELMAWMRIGELAEENDGPENGATVVVDTAPTGHTVRMLSASGHFRQLAEALDAMQGKHRAMVRQFTRRDVRDAMDAFLEDFAAQAERRRTLLADPTRCAFIPVLLSEPWVVEQTRRLVAEVRGEGIDVPLAVLNRAATECDCDRCRRRAEADRDAHQALAPLEVIDAPRACRPLDTPEGLLAWGNGAALPEGPERVAAEVPERSTGRLQIARMTFLAGKGGVGKTTSSAGIALQLAHAAPERRYVVISVDPAHSLRDVFAHESPPANLAVEAIDSRTRWRQFRDQLGEEIERAVAALTPGSLSVAYDTDAMRKLIEIAPPGVDELFAISRLSDLLDDSSIDGIIVDTAPTGHFLRLLDLPRTAGEWVRELMRILLRYRELVPAGALGEELVRASRALKELDQALHSDRAAVLVVTRPERMVVAETQRLTGELVRRGIRVGGTIANYVTPESDCRCDRSQHRHELAALATLGPDVVTIPRHDRPVVALAELGALFTTSLDGH